MHRNEGNGLKDFISITDHFPNPRGFSESFDKKLHNPSRMDRGMFGYKL